MKIFLKDNVVERAKKRINYLMDRFGEVAVCYSGGKDSEIILDLVRKENKKRNRKTKVFFLDQELEWESTINRVRTVMYSEDIEPYWVQTYFKLSNASSFKTEFLDVWGEDSNWIREKDPLHIEYDDKKLRFEKSLDYIFLHGQLSDVQGLCSVGGVRAEESPARSMATKHLPFLEDITWGKDRGKDKNGNSRYLFYPIFDWTVGDVWKYIFDNGIEVNTLYDKQFSYGIPLPQMRVSSLIHETALRSLKYFQEFEPQTYEKCVERLDGIEEYGMLGEIEVKELPYMFSSWEEYRDYLVDNLFEKQLHKDRIRKFFDSSQVYLDKLLELGIIDRKYVEDIRKGEIHSILCNDWEGVKLKPLYNRMIRSQSIRKILKQIDKVNYVFTRL